MPRMYCYVALIIMRQKEIIKIYSIKLYFYGSDQIVPFDYKEILLSFLHNKILGKDNKYHNDISLYSTSPLFNSKTIPNKGLTFKTGAIWYIRTPDCDIAKDFYIKSKNAANSELGYGLVLKNVEFKVDEFNNETSLNVGVSQIYLGQNPHSTKKDHLISEHENELTSGFMKRTIITKAKKMNIIINENDFNIEFDRTKPLKIKQNIIGKNMVFCTSGNVNITANKPEIIPLCYGLGIGLSTGSGFGFIYNLKK